MSVFKEPEVLLEATDLPERTDIAKKRVTGRRAKAETRFRSLLVTSVGISDTIFCRDYKQFGHSIVVLAHLLNWSKSLKHRKKTLEY